MKAGIMIGAALAAAGLGAVGMAATIAQPESEHPGKRYIEQYMAGASDPNAMAAYMEASKTGIAHELVAMFEGEFEAVNRMWMDPEGEPIESAAKSTNRMIMGGRYLQTSYEGDIMGMPFTGMGLMGYDNNRKLFTNMWIDSMSTGIATAMGNVSKDGTAITFIGTMDEPTTGEMGKSYKQVFRLVDENTHVMEMWEILYGEPMKMMEITYTRID